MTQLKNPGIPEALMFRALLAAQYLKACAPPEIAAVTLGLTFYLTHDGTSRLEFNGADSH